MALTWTSPAALWLLAIVPVVWFVRRFGRTNFNATQRFVQAAVRSLLLASLALALARPVISTGSSQMSVVYLVDVSHSIASRGITDVADRIDEINAELRPAHSRVMAFGTGVELLDSTAALRAVAGRDPADPASAGLGRDGTDLEQALRQARAELMPGHVPRVVLFTDGRSTAGDADAAAVELSASGIPVFTEPLVPRDLGDTWLDGLTLPDRLSPGTLATATIAVGSQRRGTAVVELRASGKVLASRPAAIEVGLTSVPLDFTLADVGAQAVDAVVTMPGDPLDANNRLTRQAVVQPRPRVLYVEGASASARYLDGALTQSGFDVTTAGASALPRQPSGLDAWDAVILSDVPRSAIHDDSMKALGEWVERDGGGLLVAGGESVFGEATGDGPAGYRNTELERVTPVTFERKDEPEVALVIVLDKSWSMAGSVMELCKAAAQAAIDVLSDEQTIGVVTFNDGLNWDVPLRNVGKNRDAIRKAVSAIEPSGHTLIYPAVEQAYVALKNARARAKHVVLLSDGRSYPDDYEGLVKKMVEAKMTVSSIAVGPAADVELLTDIAKWGKGRSYIVEDAKEVPQIFVKEAKNAATPSFDEKPLKPQVKEKAFLDGVDLSGMPALRGRTATVLKDTALELLATEDGDPLLAFWPAGLGRTAVFASDVKDRWASDWLKWRGYGPFFAAIVRAVARQPAANVGMSVAAGVVRGTTRPVAVAIEARDPQGNYLDRLKPTVRVRAGDGTSVEQPARQVAPGRYEARVIADARQPLVVSMQGASVSVSDHLIIPDPGAEYRFRPPDPAVLDAIARATGGAVGATPAALREHVQSQAARRAAWPVLVAVALVLWLADIVLRRVRIGEEALLRGAATNAP